MTRERLGEPVQLSPPEELITDGPETPGLDWEISKEAQEEIEEIEANSRVAEQQSGEIALR